MLLKKEKSYIFIFLFSFALAALIFLPFLIYDKGLFLFYGDYNVQQIPFYQTCVEAVRSGNIYYSFLTDLGTGFLPGYSFYLLGSPFFYIACLFPASFTPYLMAPLYMLKFAVAATTSYGFIKRFTKKNDAAIIGALLYAFSGFNVYNIFFNHFNDVVALFPLMLIAFDELAENNRRGVFALTVAMMAVVNYFFFIGEALFLVIYFVIRVSSGGYKDFKFSRFLSIVAEALLGVGIAAAVLLPSMLYVLSNPRSESFYTGMDALIYDGNAQRYGAILESFFFMPELPARPNMFPDGGAKWASLSAYLPFFTTVGVFSFLKIKKGHYLRRLFLTLGFMALVPVLNAAFYGFNASYYARWYYLLTIVMATMTAVMLDEEADLSFGIKSTVAATLAFVIIGIIPTWNNEEQKYHIFNLPEYVDRYWIYIAVSALSLALLIMFYKLCKSDRDKLMRVFTIATASVIFLYSVIFITLGKTHSYNDTFIIDQLISGRVNLPEDEFYRVDEYEGMDNTPLFWGYKSIRFFHSCVSSSIMEFYPEVGIKRDVSSKPDFSLYTVRSFLSTKYIFAKEDSDEMPSTQGYSFIDSQNGYNIFLNDNFISMGYQFKYYITYDEFMGYNISSREKLLCSAIVLTDEQVEKYGKYFIHLDSSEYNWSYENFKTQCKLRNQSSCQSFTETKKGFSAVYDGTGGLQFFSVPYDKGFRAYVNGTEVPIEKVDIGFMAVPVSDGYNEIVFEYLPYGFRHGVIITVSSLIILGAYLLISKRIKRCKK